MAFNINAHVILQGPKNISAVAKNIQTQLQNINVAIGVNIPKNVQNQINALNKQLNNLNSTNQKVTSGANSAASSIQGIGNQAKQTSNAMQVLGKETALTFKRFAAAGIVTATFFKMTQAIGTAIPKALEFERGLVRLQQITGSTRKGLDKLKNSVNSLAKNFGKDANELLELSQIFAQTGQNLRQVEASVRAVARSSLAPTFGEMKQTAEGLVAALNQFGIAASDSEKVLGSLNRVSKKFAVESDDLIAAIRRAGGVFAISAGQFKEPITALNEFSAIFTAVRSTTRENAETIATGLRTIFSRLQRRGTIDMLQELGINLTDAKGKFIGLFESFKKLSTGLKGLVQEGDAITLSKITEELGGIRQIGKLIPAIKNFNKAEAAFKEAQRGATEGLGKDVAKGLTPLIVQFEKVRERFSALIRTISDSSTFQALAKTAIGIANAFLSVSESLTPIIPILTKLAAFKLAKGASSFFQGFFGSVGAGGGAGGVGGNLGRVATGQGPRGGAGGVPGGLAGSMKAMNTAVGLLNKSTGLNTRALDNLTKAIGRLETKIGNINFGGGPRRGGARGPGARTRGFATGGLVPGQGNRDTVPAMLTPGEFVIKKSSVNSIGAGNLASMNYAAGGKVTSGRNYYGNKSTKKKSKTKSPDATSPNAPLVVGEITGAFGLGVLEATGGTPKNLGKKDVLISKINKEGGAVARAAIDSALSIAGLSLKQLGKAPRLTAPEGRFSKIQDTGKSVFKKEVVEGIPTMFTNALVGLGPPLGPKAGADKPGDEPFKNLISKGNLNAVIGNLFESFIRRAAGQVVIEGESDPLFDFQSFPEEINKQLFGGKGARLPLEIKAHDSEELVASTFAKRLKEPGGGISLSPDLKAIASARDGRLPESQVSDYSGDENIASFFAKGGAVGNVQHLSKGGGARGSRVKHKKSPASHPTLSANEIELMLAEINNRPLPRGVRAAAVGNSGRKISRSEIARLRGEQLEQLGLTPPAKRVKKAAGGAVGTDTVPAMLTPGEFVINRKSAQGIGYSNLKSMNSSGKLAGYAAGGVVKGNRHFYGEGGGGLSNAAFIIPDLLFTLPMLTESFKQLNEGVEGAGAQFTSTLLSLGTSLLFVIPNIKGLGKSLDLFGGAASREAFTKGFKRNRAQGGGFFGGVGRGVRGAGKGSFGRGVGKLSVAGTGLTAAALGPAIAGGIGIALAGPISELATGVQNLEKVAGFKGSKTESASEAAERGKLKGTIAGVSAGAALGFIAGGPVGAAIGGGIGLFFGKAIGEAEGIANKIRFDAIVSLNDSAKKASEALIQLAKDTFVTAEDLTKANTQTSAFLSNLSTGGEFAEADATSTFGAENSNKFKVFGEAIASAFTLGIPDFLSSSNLEGLSQADEVNQRAGSRTGFADFVERARGGGNSKTEREVQGDIAAGKIQRKGTDLFEKLKVFDPKLAEQSSEALANSLTSVTDTFIKASSNSTERIRKLQASLGSIDTTDPQKAVQGLETFIEALEGGDLGEAGKAAADTIKNDLALQLAAGTAEAIKGLDPKDAQAVSAQIQDVIAASQSDAPGAFSAALFKMNEELNKGGDNLKGAQRAFGRITKEAAKNTLATSQQATQQAIVNNLLEASNQLIDGLVSALQKLTGAMQQTSNTFDIFVSNTEKRIASLLSGQADFSLDEVVNPFENLDIQGLEAGGITPAIENAFKEIASVGGTGATDTLKGLEAAPRFAREIPDILKDSINEISNESGKREGKLLTNKEMLDIIEKRATEKDASGKPILPTGPLLDSFLKDMEKTLTQARQGEGGISDIRAALGESGEVIEKFSGVVKEVIAENSEQFKISQEIAQRASDIAKVQRDVQKKYREFDIKRTEIDNRVGDITGERKGSLAQAQGDLNTQIARQTGQAVSILGADGKPVNVAGGVATGNVGALQARQTALQAKKSQIEAARAAPGQSTNEVLISNLATVKSALEDTTGALNTLADDTTRLAAIESEIATLQSRQLAEQDALKGTFERLQGIQDKLSRGDFKGAAQDRKVLRQEFGAVQKLETGQQLTTGEMLKLLNGTLDPILTAGGKTQEEIAKLKTQASGAARGATIDGLRQLGINFQGFQGVDQGAAIEAKKDQARQIGAQQKAALDAIEQRVRAQTITEMNMLNTAVNELRVQMQLAAFSAAELRKVDDVQKKDVADFLDGTGRDILEAGGGENRRTVRSTRSLGTRGGDIAGTRGDALIGGFVPASSNGNLADPAVRQQVDNEIGEEIKRLRNIQGGLIGPNREDNNEALIEEINRLIQVQTELGKIEENAVAARDDQFKKDQQAARDAAKERIKAEEEKIRRERRGPVGVVAPVFTGNGPLSSIPQGPSSMNIPAIVQQLKGVGPLGTPTNLARGMSGFSNIEDQLSLGDKGRGGGNLGVEIDKLSKSLVLLSSVDPDLLTVLGQISESTKTTADILTAEQGPASFEVRDKTADKNAGESSKKLAAIEKTTADSGTKNFDSLKNFKDSSILKKIQPTPVAQSQQKKFVPVPEDEFTNKQIREKVQSGQMSARTGQSMIDENNQREIQRRDDALSGNLGFSAAMRASQKEMVMMNGVMVDSASVKDKAFQGESGTNVRGTEWAATGESMQRALKVAESPFQSLFQGFRAGFEKLSGNDKKSALHLQSANDWAKNFFSLGGSSDKQGALGYSKDFTAINKSGQNDWMDEYMVDILMAAPAIPGLLRGGFNLAKGGAGKAKQGGSWFADMMSNMSQQGNPSSRMRKSMQRGQVTLGGSQRGVATGNVPTVAEASNKTKALNRLKGLNEIVEEQTSIFNKAPKGKAGDVARSDSYRARNLAQTEIAEIQAASDKAAALTLQDPNQSFLSKMMDGPLNTEGTPLGKDGSPQWFKDYVAAVEASGKKFPRIGEVIDLTEGAAGKRNKLLNLTEIADSVDADKLAKKGGGVRDDIARTASDDAAAIARAASDDVAAAAIDAENAAARSRATLNTDDAATVGRSDAGRMLLPADPATGIPFPIPTEILEQVGKTRVRSPALGPVTDMSVKPSIVQRAKSFFTKTPTKAEAPADLLETLAKQADEAAPRPSTVQRVKNFFSSNVDDAVGPTRRGGRPAPDLVNPDISPAGSIARAEDVRRASRTTKQVVAGGVVVGGGITAANSPTVRRTVGEAAAGILPANELVADPAAEAQVNADVDVAPVIPPDAQIPAQPVAPVVQQPLAQPVVPVVPDARPNAQPPFLGPRPNLLPFNRPFVEADKVRDPLVAEERPPTPDVKARAQELINKGMIRKKPDIGFSQRREISKEPLTKSNEQRVVDDLNKLRGPDKQLTIADLRKKSFFTNKGLGLKKGQETEGNAMGIQGDRMSKANVAAAIEAKRQEQIEIKNITAEEDLEARRTKAATVVPGSGGKTNAELKRKQFADRQGRKKDALRQVRSGKLKPQNVQDFLNQKGDFTPENVAAAKQKAEEEAKIKNAADIKAGKDVAGIPQERQFQLPGGQQVGYSQLPPAAQRSISQGKSKLKEIKQQPPAGAAGPGAGAGLPGPQGMAGGGMPGPNQEAITAMNNFANALNGIRDGIKIQDVNVTVSDNLLGVINNAVATAVQNEFLNMPEQPVANAGAPSTLLGPDTAVS